MASDRGGDETLTLRPMSFRDLDAVLENEVRSYAFPWTRGVFADCLRSSYECWVLVAGELPIGHGILSVGANEAHLLNLCIRRDRQGEGHGRALAHHMLERARQRDAHLVILEVRPSNRAAIALYETLGFREIGRRPDYYPADGGHEDAIVLALTLDDPPASVVGDRSG
jgi:ribosomal-protein-alanine N-acetyltransferase